ncbi:MAG TPA: nucleoside diphosphate kinase regulator [Xanthomonadaceae bacterium]|nr:nucleoside diphosphate kinase regulator [Xanthomonadaceae bacterium]
MSQTQPSIVISSSDLERLETLLDRPQYASTAGADLLRREINRADVRSPQEMPADVITMNSTARFRNVDSGETREMSLVYPSEADAGAGRVSILAPVGSALLGLSVGQEIDWPGPDGRQLRLRVEAILHQPEAAGDFTR